MDPDGSRFVETEISSGTGIVSKNLYIIPEESLENL